VNGLSYIPESKPYVSEGTVYVLLRDISKALKAVKVTNEYDLVTLNGLDETYSIEGIGKNYLLVRPNMTGLLTLIDLETSERTELYKQLDAKEQEYNDVPYHGDNLKFDGEKDGVLHFSYHSIFNGKVNETTYNLK
jgi:hypothetical protein